MAPNTTSNLSNDIASHEIILTGLYDAMNDVICKIF